MGHGFEWVLHAALTALLLTQCECFWLYYVLSTLDEVHNGKN